MEKEYFTVGMIVSCDGVVGVINDVGNDALDGNRASVMWVDGDASAWHSFEELEILEDPLDKYREPNTRRQKSTAYLTAETGEVRSCENEDLTIYEEVVTFLEDLDADDYDVDEALGEMFSEDVEEVIVPYSLAGEEEGIYDHELKITFE